MNNTEIIDQLCCLKEFCQAQIQPDANRMWAQDVEALTAVIERLEWHGAVEKAGEKIKMPSDSTANEEVFHTLTIEEVPEYHIAKVSPRERLNRR